MIDPSANAVFSPDRRYRYALWRHWDITQDVFWEKKHPSSSFVAFIGLNPSTADEVKDDPTIRRCIAFAQRWGYPRMCMLNLFAYRATDPKEMKKQDDPVGPSNDRWICAFARACREQNGIVIAAWGSHGTFRHRSRAVRDLLKEDSIPIHALGTTASGEPRHPLYLGGHLNPEPLVI